ncbi:uncharacterized protein LOC143035001 [Oratosquilla oratoria]|uniref:uncharacterized protein LOC143035001 n=1 Tax=Oratosquilla oratoria TaxID=337810 RepID=UPI003F76D0A7
MMCAFMMPVVKNDWEVYQSRRSRNNSEGSQVSGGLPPPPSRSAAHVRKKAIGAKGRSMSYHAPSSAMHHDLDPRSPLKSYHLSTRNSRNASRVSMNTGMATDPHSHSHSQSSTSPKQSGPRKSPSAASLNKFPNMLMEKLRAVLHMKDQEAEDSESPAKDSRGQS